MRKLTATICLTLAMPLGSAGVSASADFQKGLTAARSGDFATALREWTPLKIQGMLFTITTADAINFEAFTIPPEEIEQ